MLHKTYKSKPAKTMKSVVKSKNNPLTNQYINV